MLHGHVSTWSADEVAVWLQRQGLNDAVLAEFKGTTASVLVELTATDIKAAGVGIVMAKAVFDLIQALR